MDRARLLQVVSTAAGRAAWSQNRCCARIAVREQKGSGVTSGIQIMGMREAGQGVMGEREAGKGSPHLQWAHSTASHAVTCNVKVKRQRSKAACC